MGAFRREARERPRSGHSIRFTFAAMVAVPVACLLALWALALAGALSGKVFGPALAFDSPRETALFGLAVGAGLTVALVSALLVALFARRLSREITGLAAAARLMADDRLPRLVERMREGKEPAGGDEDPPVPRTKVAEVGQVAAAIARLEEAALAAAAGEASMRSGVGQVFVSLARRNQSLLQRQLRLIDSLEQKAPDPAALADLFPLDHLTTRMRRHAEGLIILSGAAPGRSWSEPVPVIDVLRGAVGEVEDYQRVVVNTRAEDAVAGAAVADMVHLLAELIENATLFSPSGTRVEVRAERVANGFAVEIDDRGLGIKPGQLDTINQQFASPPDFDLANADQLGLFVVGKLAARHGVQVKLRASPFGGTTAIVLMPNAIVVPAAAAGTQQRAGAQPAVAGAALSLTGLPVRRPQQAVSGVAPRGNPAAAAAAAGTAPGPDRPGPDAPAPATTAPVPPPAPGTPPDGFARPDPAVNGTAAGTYRGLPRRIRQTSLSPHLRDGPAAAAGPGGPQPDGGPPADSRTPEQARDLMASLQSGWLRGRRDGTPGDGPAGGDEGGGAEPDGGQAAGEQAPGTAPGEET